MTVCLECVVFTIKGTSIENNKYISIFYIWLSLCIKNSGLGKDDQIRIKIDSETFEYCKQNMLFAGLLTHSACPIKIILFPPPNDVIDGMMIRFKKVAYTQDIFMYSDIDILIIKPIHALFTSITENNIGVHIEGLINDINYGACFTEEELAVLTPESPGCSSGKFIIYGKELYSELLDIITTIYTKDTLYYCHDQTFYNKALYLLDKQKYKLTALDQSVLSINGHLYTPHTILLDVMGMPGDGQIHFDKMLMFSLLHHSNLLDTILLQAKA